MCTGPPRWGEGGGLVRLETEGERWVAISAALSDALTVGGFLGALPSNIPLSEDMSSSEEASTLPLSRLLERGVERSLGRRVLLWESWKSLVRDRTEGIGSSRVVELLEGESTMFAAITDEERERFGDGMTDMVIDTGCSFGGGGGGAVFPKLRTAARRAVGFGWICVAADMQASVDNEKAD